MKKIQKCYLCGGEADTTETKEFFIGFCKNCKKKLKPQTNNNKRKALNSNIENYIEIIEKKLSKLNLNLFKPNTNTINFGEINSPKKEKQIIQAPAQKSPFDFNDKTGFTKKENKIFQALKSSIRFNGEERPLNHQEQKISTNLICPYCELPIDRKLYFYPLAIHKCGIAYHRECLAKLMAKGEYKCITCKKNLFISNDSNDLNNSDDSDDSNDNFF